MSTRFFLQNFDLNLLTNSIFEHLMCNIEIFCCQISTDKTINIFRKFDNQDVINNIELDFSSVKYTTFNDFFNIFSFVNKIITKLSRFFKI